MDGSLPPPLSFLWRDLRTDYRVAYSTAAYIRSLLPGIPEVSLECALLNTLIWRLGDWRASIGQPPADTVDYGSLTQRAAAANFNVAESLVARRTKRGLPLLTQPMLEPQVQDMLRRHGEVVGVLPCELTYVAVEVFQVLLEVSRSRIELGAVWPSSELLDPRRLNRYAAKCEQRVPTPKKLTAIRNALIEWGWLDFATPVGKRGRPKGDGYRFYMGNTPPWLPEALAEDSGTFAVWKVPAATAAVAGTDALVSPEAKRQDCVQVQKYCFTPLDAALFQRPVPARLLSLSA